jgi:ABC-type transport system substrate-binding protein
VVAVLAVLAGACSSDKSTTAPATTDGVAPTTAVGGAATPTSAAATASTTAASGSASSAPGTAAATSTAPAPSGDSGGTLVVAQSADPTSLDPYRYGSTNDRNIIANMYETLVTFDLTSYKIVGSLADSWSVSTDGLTHTFKLHPGVTFHDGSPFGAADVVKSMERAKDPASGRTTSLLAGVTATTAVDDLTVEIHLATPDRVLLSTLVDVYISPRSDSVNLGIQPNGTGPFTFKSAAANQQVEIVKNPKYWRAGLPFLDGVTYRTIPDGTVQSLLARNGEVDMLATTPLGEIGKLQAAGLQIIGPAKGFNSGLYNMHTNTRKDPWSNKLVRQAASFALNRDAMARSLFGFMTVQSNPSAISASLNPAAASYDKQDLDKAKALMAEANLGNGVDGGEMIVCGLGFQFETLAQLVQLQLADIGIKVKITVLDVATYVARTLGKDSGNFDLALCAMVPKPNEYDLINHPYAKLFTQTIGWIDQAPEFYQLLADARTMTDDAQYAAAIQQLQIMAMDGQAEIILGGAYSPVTAAADVKGFIAHTQGTLFLANVSKSR